MRSDHTQRQVPSTNWKAPEAELEGEGFSASQSWVPGSALPSCSLCPDSHAATAASTWLSPHASPISAPAGICLGST